MRESIEDRIIAYFDGRLTDGESAELLHRVSVSPEIRKLFRDHEMLRELARSAQATAVVRPEIEANIFAQIEALAAAEQAPVPIAAEEETRRKAVPFFWTRWRLGLATALGAFVLGTAITLGPELFGDKDGAENGTRSVTSRNSTSSSSGETPVVTPKDAIAGNDEIAQDAHTSTKPDYNKIIRGDRDYEARQASNERPSLVGVPAHKSYQTHESHTSYDEPSTNSKAVDNTELASSSIAITPVDLKRSNTAMALGGEKGITPVFRAEVIEQKDNHFEASVETSSGFSYPADGPGIQPFADPRISFGYFMDRHNIIGARFTSGLFETLPERSINKSASYTSVSRNLEQERLMSAGLYYSHRFYGVLTDLINFDLSVGGDYIFTGGYALTGELGLRLPISSKLFINTSFALTRVHFNAPSMEDITNSVSVEDGPVLIEGSDVQNTINGRIHYGLSYQF